MNRLFEAEVFVRVVEDGSLTAAAKRLGMTTSYASKLVTRLEQRLGARLLVRTTRKLTLTDTGRAYYERCTEAIRGLEEAEQMATQEQQAPRGTLRVTVPSAFGSLFALGVLAEFKAAYPALILELMFLDRQVDLIGEGFDVGLRIGELGDERLIARRLTTTDRIVLASPAYLAIRGAPMSFEGLRGHHIAMRGPTPQVLLRHDVVERITTDEIETALVAVLGGVGLSVLPRWLVEADVRAGRLVHVLPQADLGAVPVVATYPSAKRLRKAARLVLERLGEGVRDALGGA